MALALGTAKVDVTPRGPVPLAGYAHRSGVAGGVAAPLYLRVFLFEGVGEGKHGARALLVSADLIWWGPERVPGLKAQLAARWGLIDGGIVLHATHTHSGPQTSECFHPSLGAADDGYLAELEAQLQHAVEQAAGGIEPVTVSRGRRKARMGINRRRARGGRITMAPNPRGPIDHELEVVSFNRPDGLFKAALMHYACHPTTTDENLVSSEFPGTACEALESASGPGTVVAFLQGCCGDVRPALISEGRFYRGGGSDVRRLGHALAGQAAKILSGGLQPLKTSAPWAVERRVHLRLQAEEEEDSVSLELTKLDLDGVGFVAMNCEPVTAYGHFIKSLTSSRLLPLGYSNGMFGYLVTDEQVRQGGYEGRDSCEYFNLRGPLAPGTEQEVLQALRDITGTTGEGR